MMTSAWATTDSATLDSTSSTKQSQSSGSKSSSKNYRNSSYSSSRQHGGGDAISIRSSLTSTSTSTLETASFASGVASDCPSPPKFPTRQSSSDLLLGGSLSPVRSRGTKNREKQQPASFEDEGDDSIRSTSDSCDLMNDDSSKRPESPLRAVLDEEDTLSFASRTSSTKSGFGALLGAEGPGDSVPQDERSPLGADVEGALPQSNQNDMDEGGMSVIAPDRGEVDTPPSPSGTSGTNRRRTSKESARNHRRGPKRSCSSESSTMKRRLERGHHHRAAARSSRRSTSRSGSPSAASVSSERYYTSSPSQSPRRRLAARRSGSDLDGLAGESPGHRLYRHKRPFAAESDRSVVSASPRLVTSAGRTSTSSLISETSSISLSPRSPPSRQLVSSNRRHKKRNSAGDSSSRPATDHQHRSISGLVEDHKSATSTGLSELQRACVQRHSSSGGDYLDKEEETNASVDQVVRATSGRRRRQEREGKPSESSSRGQARDHHHKSRRRRDDNEATRKRRGVARKGSKSSGSESEASVSPRRISRGDRNATLRDCDQHLETPSSRKKGAFRQANPPSRSSSESDREMFISQRKRTMQRASLESVASPSRQSSTSSRDDGAKETMGLGSGNETLSNTLSSQISSRRRQTECVVRSAESENNSSVERRRNRTMKNVSRSDAPGDEKSRRKTVYEMEWSRNAPATGKAGSPEAGVISKKTMTPKTPRRFIDLNRRRLQLGDKNDDSNKSLSLIDAPAVASNRRSPRRTQSATCLSDMKFDLGGSSSVPANRAAEGTRRDSSEWKSPKWRHPFDEDPHDDADEHVEDPESSRSSHEYYDTSEFDACVPSGSLSARGGSRTSMVRGQAPQTKSGQEPVNDGFESPVKAPQETVKSSGLRMYDTNFFSPAIARRGFSQSMSDLGRAARDFSLSPAIARRRRRDDDNDESFFSPVMLGHDQSRCAMSMSDMSKLGIDPLQEETSIHIDSLKSSTCERDQGERSTVKRPMYDTSSCFTPGSARCNFSKSLSELGRDLGSALLMSPLTPSPSGRQQVRGEPPSRSRTTSWSSLSLGVARRGTGASGRWLGGGGSAADGKVGGAREAASSPSSARSFPFSPTAHGETGSDREAVDRDLQEWLDQMPDSVRHTCSGIVEGDAHSVISSLSNVQKSVGGAKKGTRLIVLVFEDGDDALAGTIAKK